MTSSSTPTPTGFDGFAIRVKGVAAACCFPSSIRAHGAITIISTSTWEDIGYWIISTFLKTSRRRIGGGDILSSGTCGVGAGLKLVGREEVGTLSISLVGYGNVR
jgi:hypothetical protein